MHIAVLTRRFDPAGGGTERDLILTCNYLARAGHQVTVYAADMRAASGARAAAGEMRVRRAPVLPFGRTLELLSFAYFAPAAARRSRADMIISFGRTVDAELQRCGGGVHISYLRAACRWRGARGAQLMTLSPYHRVQTHVEARGFTSPRLRLALAVSRSVRDDLVATFALPQERAATLYNGVDAQRFRPPQSADAKRGLRCQLGLPESGKIVAFVGNGFARKGLGALLRAWPRLKGEPWLAVAGEDRERRAFRRLAARLGVGSRVAFLGPVRDVAPLYQAADALALPTLFEAFGNVALEAMASALPVLVSTWAGVAELVPPPLRAFLVDNPLDIDELAARLEALLEAPAHLGAAARAAAQELTWERYGLSLLELVEGCGAATPATNRQRGVL